MNLILSNIELNPDIKLLGRQTSWKVFKVTLYFFYVLTWLTILYLTKSIKGKAISLLDTSIAYFASISILLSSVGLSFFDIYAAPFFILSLAFIFKKQFTYSSIMYLFSLVFNWALLVFSPLFLLLAIKNKANTLTRAIQILCFFLIPCYVLIAHLTRINSHTQFSHLIDLHKHLKIRAVGVCTAFGLSLVYLIKYFVFHKRIPKEVFLLAGFLLTVLFVLLTILWPDFPLWISSILFVLFYLKLLKEVSIVKTITNIIISRIVLATFLIFVLLVPNMSAGRLLWIPLLSLILFIVDKSSFSKLGLILVNLIVFMNLYTSFGTSGVSQIKGIYFDFFGYIFLSCLIFFICWHFVTIYRFSFHKISLQDLQQLSLQTKWFLVVVMVLIILALIPADGSSDHVSWTQYAVASIAYPNPFRAYTDVILQYPPLSIVIISVFANTWKSIIGLSADYTIAIKLSILTFYILLVGYLLRFKIPSLQRYKLFTLDKLIIILTTFSLIIQTQGLADINIYIIPSLFASILLLFKKKYLLSGIMMGFTLSIKWQPAILLPLFVITLMHSRGDIKKNLRRLITFTFGFLIIPIISWFMVLIQPGGYFATVRAFEFFGTDNLLLSGQALNINWVATYIVHIFDPVTYGSLQQMDYLNRQIPIFSAPWILRGQFFIVMTLAIIIFYWRLKRKDIVTFLCAAVMIFFSHHQLNKSAYEKHLFYVMALMLFLCLIRPTLGNRRLLVLFDIMVIMNLIFFYGTAGTGPMNRLFFGFDITIIFSIYYFIIYLWVMKRYFKGDLLLEK